MDLMLLSLGIKVFKFKFEFSLNLPPPPCNCDVLIYIHVLFYVLLCSYCCQKKFPMEIVMLYFVVLYCYLGLNTTCLERPRYFCNASRVITDVLQNLPHRESFAFILLHTNVGSNSPLFLFKMCVVLLS